MRKSMNGLDRWTCASASSSGLSVQEEVRSYVMMTDVDLDEDPDEDQDEMGISNPSPTPVGGTKSTSDQGEEMGNPARLRPHRLGSKVVSSPSTGQGKSDATGWTRQ